MPLGPWCDVAELHVCVACGHSGAGWLSREPCGAPIAHESMEMLGITPPLPVPRPAYQGTSG